MTETSLHQSSASPQAPVCSHTTGNGEPCGTVAGRGPFAEAYDKYQAQGWRGTLPVARNTKSEELPYGFTGVKFANVWPEPHHLHTWSHRNGANLVLRMPQNVVGIDADQYEKGGHVKQGIDNLRSLEEQLGSLPPSYRSTRRGGENPSGIRFYRVPELGSGWPGKVCEDVETVHHGHRFAVVWPSEVPHEDTGESLTYQWFSPDDHAMPGPPAVKDLPLLPAKWVAYLQREHKSNGGVITSASDFPEAVEIPSEVPSEGPWYMKAMASSGAGGRGHDNLTAVIGGIVRITMKAGEPFAVAQALALNYERASDDPQSDEKVVAIVERFWAQDSARRRTEESPAGFPEVETGSGFTTEGITVLRRGRDGHPVVADLFTKETGWLGVVDDQFTMTKAFETEDKQGNKGKEVKAVPVADFHLEPVRVVKGAEGLAWRVKVVNEHGELIDERQISSRVIGNMRELESWISKNACVFYPRNQTFELFMSGSNLMRYLKSFELEELEEIDYVGWNPTYGCYVTPEGVIKPGSAVVRPFTDVLPSEFAAENCMMKFGCEIDIDGAREVVRETLGWQDRDVMLQMWSFMAMVVTRGQFHEGSFFPALNIQGYSGAAKTSLTTKLLQMIGVSSIGSWTQAAAKATYATARNGVVAWDDVRIDESTQEMVRTAITGGVKNKMNAADGSKRASGRSRAATILLSEGMTSRFNAQKANRDRFITIEMPDVSERRSKRNPSLSLYEGDIKPVAERFGDDFTRISVAVLAGLLEHVDAVGSIRGSTRGEQSDGVLEAGARLLASYLGEPGITAEMTEILRRKENLGNASTVVLEVLPAIWRDLGYPCQSSGMGLVLPVYRDGETGPFKVNTAKAADYWKRLGVRNHRDEVLGDESGIKTELKNNKAEAPKRATNVVVSEIGEDGTKTSRATTARYWTLPLDLSHVIADVALGNNV